MLTRKKIFILLIEDNAVDVIAIRRAFKTSNLDLSIVVAADGQEALEKLRDGKSIQKPYIALLDLNMPRMNGLEFLEAARKDPELNSMVVFVITTSDSSEDKTKAYQHNIAGYIVKGKHESAIAGTAALCDQYAQLVELP